MKIQQLIERNEYPPMTEMLKRVNALVKAAKNITAGGTVAAMAIIHDEVGKALSDMEKNGDV